MNLHQIQAAYRSEEDRILLRLSFSEGDGPLEEIRTWLTRRLVKTLWPGIMHALETQVMLDHPHAAHARAEMVNMTHHATIDQIRSSGKFDVPFVQQAQRFPFGEQPILADHANILLQTDHIPRIQFVTAHSGSFEVSFTPSMLHGLCTLLQEAVKQAEWDIELRLPGVPMEQGSERRVLN